LQENADVIFAVSGPIAQGTAVAVREAGGPAADKYMLWVDSDGCVADPGNCDVVLSTVEKKIDSALTQIIEQTLGGAFPAGEYVGTLANEGVGLADFHDLAADVPAELQSELTDLAAGVADGTVTVGP
jgi:basic membrane protein A